VSYITSDPSRVTRIVSTPLIALGAAAGVGVIQTLGSFDDAKVRRLTGVYSTFQTKNSRIQILVAGKLVLEMDCSMFAAALGFTPVDVFYNPNQQFQWAENSPTGGPAFTASTDTLSLRYETTPEGQQV
jgi:hypothetical protein